MREQLRDPEAGDRVWRRLQHVFRLPDPRTFPALGISWTADELEMLMRFIKQAEYESCFRPGFMNAARPRCSTS